MDFIMKGVEPKDGAMKYIHFDVMNRPCYIDYIKLGESAIIVYLPDWDDREHRLRTSRVLRYLEKDDGKQIIIETRNTVYTLEASE